MTDTLIARLRELANAATPGPWKIKDRKVVTQKDNAICGAPVFVLGAYKQSMANAEHIAAASPDVVLGLIDRIEALQYEVEMWKATANAVVDFEKVELRAEVVDAKEIQTELQEVITEMCNAIPDYDWSGGAAEKIKDAFTRLKALESERAGIIQRSNEIISSLAAGAADAGLPFVPWSKEAEMRESWTQAAPTKEPINQKLADALNELYSNCLDSFSAGNYDMVMAREALDLYKNSPEMNASQERVHETAKSEQMPLTDEQIEDIGIEHIGSCFASELGFARAIEAAHGIKEPKV